MRFLQLDNNVVTGYLIAYAAPTDLPEGRSFIPFEGDGDAPIGATYDPETGEFTPGPSHKTRVTHADVLALLTPTEWAEMNKFHPEAEGTAASGTPYNDAQVFWAVSVFNKAAYIDLSDSRFASILTLLASKSILTPERSLQLQQQLAALAASK